MSWFYLVVYLFIGIILLLCIISFLMYMCRVCKTRKIVKRCCAEEYLHGENARSQNGRPSAGRSLISTDNVYDRQSRNPKVEHIQLLDIKKSMYEQKHDSHETLWKLLPISSKSSVPNKLNSHSKAGNSLHKPSQTPSPPPSGPLVAISTPSIIKAFSRKSNIHPPLPPTINTTENNSSNVYHNFSYIQDTTIDDVPTFSWYVECGRNSCTNLSNLWHTNLVSRPSSFFKKNLDRNSCSYNIYFLWKKSFFSYFQITLFL